MRPCVADFGVAQGSSAIAMQAWQECAPGTRIKTHPCFSQCDRLLILGLRSYAHIL
jgi:hypothetical protein